MSEKRIRTLTYKGMALFEEQVINFNKQLKKAWDSVCHITEKQLSSLEESALTRVENELNIELDKYETVSTAYCTYLNSVNSGESKDILCDVLKVHESRTNTVQKFRDDIIQKKQLIPRKSVFSSEKSHSRSTSSNSVTARAKADAARARVIFAEKEAALRKQKALLEEQDDVLHAKVIRQNKDLETDLVLLQQQKEAAAAEAEASALQGSLNLNGSRAESIHSANPQIHTAEYIINHSDVISTAKSKNIPSRSLAIPASTDARSQMAFCEKEQSDNNQLWNGPVTNLDPTTPVFVPQEKSPFIDIAKFLMKKDLSLQRLTSFNDKPETFYSWKNSFVAITTELDVNPSEELDMLVRYLGPESKKHAISMRTANANNPRVGLEKLWKRLHERYGSAEMIESALKHKLENFPRISSRDNEKLYELSDILAEIDSSMKDPIYESLLSYFNTSSGIRPIVGKLPYHLQNKWTTCAMKYIKDKQVAFPPFTEFCQFITDMSSMMNNPGFIYTTEVATKSETSRAHKTSAKVARVNKTEIVGETNTGFTFGQCPIHKTNHTLNECRAFKCKTISDRKHFLREHKICFKCCESDSHVYKTCTSSVKCGMCDSERHPTALHSNEYRPPVNQHGREGASPKDRSKELKSQHSGESSNTVSNKCTNICGEGFKGRSCSKTMLVKVHPASQPENSRTVYAIIDDQSNQTLGKPQLFDMMNVNTNKTTQYNLVSCAGSYPTQGRLVSDLVVSAIDNTFSMNLPGVLECDQIPDSRSEIPTPEITQYYKHLKGVTIPKLDPDTDILLLIGRDVPEAHHVYDQRTGPLQTPFAQKLGLGWTIIGDVCLGQVHKPHSVNVLKTQVLDDGRSTLFTPCENQFDIKKHDTLPDLDIDVFCQTKHDNKPGLSIEDKTFLEIMDTRFVKNELGNWSAPLPFRRPRPRLPNNRSQALKRAQILDAGLRRDPQKKQHFLDFMENILEKQHAEIAPPLQEKEECWYLPIFGVYHPKKKDQLRAVFDSSAKYEGVSLNSMLLSGPDLTNSLVGILLRFREGAVAITADIQQMFYQFNVHQKDRNYLRFLWYRDNDMSNELVEYRMCVHVFGNSPSPAVATYGLRKTATNAVQNYGSDVKDFVDQNFYVDDGLASLPSAEEAVSLMQRTQQALSTEGKLRLHKIASNSKDVLKAFPEEDLDKGLKNLDLESKQLPVQRSLGLGWNLQTDCFVFQVSDRKEAPYTKRGVLSTINSLFDPLGFLAPVTIGGRILLRDITSEVEDWDEPLPEMLHTKWEMWVLSLQDLKLLSINRTYFTTGRTENFKVELHIFSDASEKAIAAVAFLKTTDAYGISQVGFVLGKSKVAPKHGHTIPRLELCAAVLAVEIAEVVSEEMTIQAASIIFHTDSKVVLGYLQNKTRRFYVYVENRVSRILKSSTPEQWLYVPTENNPADFGTRYTHPSVLGECAWLTGEPVLETTDCTLESEYFPIVSPEEDADVRPEVHTLKTSTEDYSCLGTERFKRFSSWLKLILAISLLIHIVDNIKNINSSSCQGWHLCEHYRTVESQSKTKTFIIRQVQHKAYKREIQCLTDGNQLPRDSSVLKLSPFLDEHGILRVGGRLHKSKVVPVCEKHPVLIPGDSHIATLLIRHFHESIHHQGRHLTEGAVRSAGYWVTGGKRLISLLIHKCVTCRKLRGRLNCQKMSDLPEDRVTPAPPFSSVGVDVFGPWEIVTRRTRGGAAASKRWAVIFTCQSTRAIHLELIEEMSSSSFINALRRFYAIRGKVQEFHSDRGTNFIGATDDLHINAINVEDDSMKNLLYKSETVWKFNTPYSSHMGGSWERLIGICRRILDSMLLDVRNKQLTHEVLSTFMAEVMAIVNARPIVSVSTDADTPFVLTPSILLTQKTGNPDESFQHLDVKDMYTAHWKHVQVLSETFWRRWRQEYLPTIQPRQKWHQETCNIAVGDVVLLRDKSVIRNDWPTGLVTRVFPSDDDLVRKVELRVIKDGKPVKYVRPIVELVKLV